MSRLRRIEIMEPYCPLPLLYRESSIFTPPTLAFPSFFEEEQDLSFALDFLNPRPSSFELFDTFSDLIQIDRYKRVKQRTGTDLYLESLCDRVSRLESKFEKKKKKNEAGNRKYSWTAEIQTPEKNGFDRKYKWTKEIKDGKESGIKWTTEIKGKGEKEGAIRKYTIEAASSDAADSGKLEKKHKKKDKKDKKEDDKVRIVEIEEPTAHGAVVLRQAFSKRAGASSKAKGKKKELSLQDAAMMIQMSFRAYLIRRSQALRALRELAIAKAKLKELRALFNNFSYRRRLASDAVERQRFSEKIIVLLLTVDAIEGADLMVRSAKRSMVDELEAMLDVVDPQPAGRSLSVRRRTFDMPDGTIQKEIAESVAQVVQMIGGQENGVETFEACL